VLFAKAEFFPVEQLPPQFIVVIPDLTAHEKDTYRQ
jgi:hypothetical protein